MIDGLRVAVESSWLLRAGVSIYNACKSVKNMKKGEWCIRKYNLFLLANMAIYLLVSGIFIQKSMFDGGDADGFYRQIIYVANEGSWATNPLHLVHLLRFLLVSPFYYLYVNDIHVIFESILILLFLMPVLTIKFGLKQYYFQAFFVYLPLFFSYRSVLVMCSISYLFICLYGGRRSYLMLALSMLMANLSSGVVLSWILIAFMNIKYLSKNYKYFGSLALGIVIVFGFSVSHKIGFFYNESAGGNSILERNTFYVSIVNEQYARFTVYSLLLFSWYVISLAKIKYDSFLWSDYAFYFPMLIAFFFEGLGVVSFLIPVLWFFMGVRSQLLSHRGRGRR